MSPRPQPRSSLDGWRFTLDDGSVCVVERIERNTTVISREVDGECVWGQVMSCERARHPGQVAEACRKMQASPTAFETWQRIDARAAVSPNPQTETR